MSRFVLVSLLFIAHVSVGQDSLESLQLELQKDQSIEGRIDLLNKLSFAYSQVSLDKSEEYANSALAQAQQINYQKGVATAYNHLGISNSIRGDYTIGLDYFIKALRIREDQEDFTDASRTLNNMARVFVYQKDYEKAIEYSKRSLEYLKKADDPIATAYAQISLGIIYMDKNDRELAFEMFTAAHDQFAKSGRKDHEGWALLKIADVYAANRQYEKALAACKESMKLIDFKKDLFTSVELHQTMGQIYDGMGNRKAAMENLHTAMRLADAGGDNNGKLSSRLKLSQFFKKSSTYDSALYYHEAYMKLNEETFNSEKSRQLSTLEKAYQTEKKDQLLQLNKRKIETQSVIISSISILVVMLAVIGFMLLRYSRTKRQSNIALEKLNREIYEKHEEILAQSEELTQANEEIKRINESLEAEVRLRTTRIEAQNKMLIQYAYSNAHNVRGPLARILGLAALMENESSEALIKEYSNYMHESARELDEVVREINSKLSDENQ